MHEIHYFDAYNNSTAILTTNEGGNYVKYSDRSISYFVNSILSMKNVT